MEELENFMGHIGAGTKWLNAPKSIHEKKKNKKKTLKVKYFPSGIL